MLRMKNDAFNLKRLQEELDLSVMELATAADLHPQTVYRVLGNDGASRNSVKRVRKILNELKIKSKASG